MNVIYILFLKFVIYSIIGYICEIFYVYLNSKRIINRGFLYGPYIPIYGVGCLLINTLLSCYWEDSIVIFVMSVFICSILEYTASYLMEKIFHNRWWDYSHYKYNINGRICLKNSVLFGLGGIISIYILDPYITMFLSSIDNDVLKNAALLLGVVVLTDLVLSTFEASRACNISKHLDAIMNEYSLKKNIKLNKIRMRLFFAFPYLVNNDKSLKRLKKLKTNYFKNI